MNIALNWMSLSCPFPEGSDIYAGEGRNILRPRGGRQFQGYSFSDLTGLMHKDFKETAFSRRDRVDVHIKSLRL